MKLFNTLTGQKEEFEIKDKKVRIYACGPTVYNYFHIGNARAFIAYDVLRRYLEFLGNDVIFVQNFTDVDDKLINQSIEENITVKEIAEKYIKEYYTDADGLNIMRATVNPRATENIDNIISMIQSLIDKGFAYEQNGDVYFRVRADKDYGQLIKQNIDDLESGARIDVSEIKEDKLDFALWKSYKPGEPYWDSPWGKGRPGWHIECSAMAKNYLGDTIDIHCGGIDLVFPHHENEIAQSECANGCKFSRFWFHVAFINIDNKKMSKSKGNFFTVRELSEKYGHEPLRFFAATSYYKSPINYDTDIIEQAKTSLERLRNCRDNLEFLLKTASGTLTDTEKHVTEELSKYRQRFIDAMDDDLNAANGTAVIFELVREINKSVSDASSKELVEFAREKFTELVDVLGLLFENKEDGADTAWIESEIERRKQAKKDRNYALADQIRDELKSKGVILEDTPQGVKWHIE
ncbi:MAG: cysteine--tRNA ligase [Clostridiales bacterium]|nr:MAG: cysteine--tRNA ligase [Clostridiales bacterium]